MGSFFWSGPSKGRRIGPFVRQPFDFYNAFQDGKFRVAGQDEGSLAKGSGDNEGTGIRKRMIGFYMGGFQQQVAGDLNKLQ
jgi:hypothetical protein